MSIEVVHQSIALEVLPLHHALHGCAKLLVCPLGPDVKQFGLHCTDQIEIKSVLLDGKACQFFFQRPVTTGYDARAFSSTSAGVTPSSEPPEPRKKKKQRTAQLAGRPPATTTHKVLGYGLEDIRSYTVFQMYNDEVWDATDAGPLCIRVPAGKACIQAAVSRMPVQFDHERTCPVYQPWLVQIEYSIVNPSQGVQFVPAYRENITPGPEQCTSCFTYSNSCMPGCWFPCFNPATTLLSIKCPSHLTAVASGEPVREELDVAWSPAMNGHSQASSPDEGQGCYETRCNIFHFKCETLLESTSIGFCVSPLLPCPEPGQRLGFVSIYLAGSPDLDNLAATRDAESRPKHAFSLAKPPCEEHPSSSSPLLSSSTSSSSSSSSSSYSSSSFFPHVKNAAKLNALDIRRKNQLFNVTGFSPRESSPWGLEPPSDVGEVLGKAQNCLEAIFGVYQDYLDCRYPLGAYTMVFLDHVYTPDSTLSFAGLSLLDLSLLCDATESEATLKAWRTLALSVAKSWLSCLLLEEKADTWIVQGMTYYLQGLFLEAAFGGSEREFTRLQHHLLAIDHEDEITGAKQVVEARINADFLDDMKSTISDNASQASGATTQAAGGGTGGPVKSTTPLKWSGWNDPAELQAPHRQAKAAAVMHMLEKAMGREEFAKLWNQILSPYCQRLPVPNAENPRATAANPTTSTATATATASAAATAPTAAATSSTIVPLSTKAFFKQARAIAGHVQEDLRNFEEQWVICDTLPRLRVAVEYKRQDRSARVTVMQEQAMSKEEKKVQGLIPESAKDLTETEQSGAPPRLKFTGQCLLQLHEYSDPTEQYQKIDEAVQTFVFHCRSKGQKRGGNRETRLWKNTEGPLLYVKVDPQLMWFRPVELVTQTQQEKSIVSLAHQLTNENDHDIVSQWAAMDGLRKCAALFTHAKDMQLIAQEALEMVILEMDSKQGKGEPVFFFHGIRALAAQVLADTACYHSENYACLMNILKRFTQLAAGQSGAGGGKSVNVPSSGSEIQPNDFSSYARLLVLQSLLKALSGIRDNNNLSPADVPLELYRLLSQNDNSQNAFSDTQYLSCILDCLGTLRLTAADGHVITMLTEELHRYLRRDECMSTLRNLLTQSALLSLAKFEAAGYIPRDRSAPFEHYLEPSHFHGVRLMAVACLCRLAVSQQDRCETLLRVVETEKVPGFRVAMVRTWADTLELMEKASTSTGTVSGQALTISASAAAVPAVSSAPFLPSNPSQPPDQSLVPSIPVASVPPLLSPVKSISKGESSVFTSGNVVTSLAAFRQGFSSSLAAAAASSSSSSSSSMAPLAGGLLVPSSSTQSLAKRNRAMNDRIWHMLCLAQDQELRYQLGRVYTCLYGTRTPKKIVRPNTDIKGKKVARSFPGMQKQAITQRGELGPNMLRRSQAKQDLRSRRSKRAVGLTEVEPNLLKISLAGGSAEEVADHAGALMGHDDED